MEMLGGERVFFRNVKKEYPVIVRGEGVYLYDEGGTRYLDGCSGALVTNLGHGVVEIADALHRQALTLSFAHASRFASRPIRELGERVVSIAPPGLSRLYLVSGGSEATEAAMLIARQYYLERDGSSQKHVVISRWHSYHGSTVGSMSMSGNIGRRQAYLPYQLNFPHINAPYCYRCPYGRSSDNCGVPCAHELGQTIQRVGAQYISAFIAEPIVGAAAGAIVPPPDYHRVIREACDRFDILFIADEVMTGFGRTGQHFAIQHWDDAVPDLMTLAKGMGAGYVPLGGVLTTEKIWEAFVRGSGQLIHGHTYGGNPLASAAGVAVMDYYMKHGLAEKAARMGQILLEELRPLEDNPVVGDVRGRGLMLGVELVRDRSTGEPFQAGPGRTAEQATRLIMEHGAVVYPGGGTLDGSAGDHFLIGPPLVISEPQVRELAASIIAGLDDLAVLEDRCLKRVGG